MLWTVTEGHCRVIGNLNYCHVSPSVNKVVLTVIIIIIFILFLSLLL